MKIIKTNDNQFIKPENEGITACEDKYFVWGWRWNKNEKRWGKQLIGYWFKSFEWVEEVNFPPMVGISKELYMLQQAPKNN